MLCDVGCGPASCRVELMSHRPGGATPPPPPPLLHGAVVLWCCAHKLQANPPWGILQWWQAAERTNDDEPVSDGEASQLRL
jgi:hypothetical protein